ncbi:MAG: hypothetical protein LBM04_11970 [Opitutaceae bacterium]|jgi:hypothetical protein|nr:hypothetical protein [Opitutaceae bacterium]
MNFSNRNKTNRNKAFISNLAVLGVTLFFCLGASLFAVVWQQQNNVRIARENNLLENHIASLQRHQTELNNKLASEQTLEVLNRRNAGFRLNLSAVREQQLVRVTRDPKTLLDLKRNAERIGFLPAAPATDVPARPALARPALAATAAIATATTDDAATDADTRPSIIRFVTFSR